MAWGSGRYLFYHRKYSFKYLVPPETGDTLDKVHAKSSNDPRPGLFTAKEGKQSAQLAALRRGSEAELNGRWTDAKTQKAAEERP